MIADTTFLIDIMDGNREAILKAKMLESRGLAISITSLSKFELYAGLRKSSKKEEEQEKILNVMAWLTVYSLDEVSATETGEIYSEKRVAGFQIRTTEAMIAGICRLRNEQILTRNVKHFNGVDCVVVESY